MRFRWAGFRKVRRQVCKRIQRRLDELGLDEVEAYKERLEQEPGEWDVVDGMCRVTISRFYRDHHVFNTLHPRLMTLASRTAGRGDRVLRVWSAGCCSGEEPYTLCLIWYLGAVKDFVGNVDLRIVATDADAALIERAMRRLYPVSALREVHDAQREAAFEQVGDLFRLREEFAGPVDFRCQDIRKEFPDGHFDLILCRNLVFTYFEREFQTELLDKIVERLHPGSFLVLGTHERLPYDRPDLVPVKKCPSIIQKTIREA